MSLNFELLNIQYGVFTISITGEFYNVLSNVYNLYADSPADLIYYLLLCNKTY